MASKPMRRSIRQRFLAMGKGSRAEAQDAAAWLSGLDVEQTKNVFITRDSEIVRAIWQTNVRMTMMERHSSPFVPVLEAVEIEILGRGEGDGTLCLKEEACGNVLNLVRGRIPGFLDRVAPVLSPATFRALFCSGMGLVSSWSELEESVGTLLEILALEGYRKAKAAEAAEMAAELEEQEVDLLKVKEKKGGRKGRGRGKVHGKKKKKQLQQQQQQHRRRHRQKVVEEEAEEEERKKSVVVRRRALVRRKWRVRARRVQVRMHFASETADVGTWDLEKEDGYASEGAVESVRREDVHFSNEWCGRLCRTSETVRRWEEEKNQSYRWGAIRENTRVGRVDIDVVDTESWAEYGGLSKLCREWERHPSQDMPWVHRILRQLLNDPLCARRQRFTHQVRGIGEPEERREPVEIEHDVESNEDDRDWITVGRRGRSIPSVPIETQDCGAEKEKEEDEDDIGVGSGGRDTEEFFKEVTHETLEGKDTNNTNSVHIERDEEQYFAGLDRKSPENIHQDYEDDDEEEEDDPDVRRPAPPTTTPQFYQQYAPHHPHAVVQWLPSVYGGWVPVYAPTYPAVAPPVQMWTPAHHPPQPSHPPHPHPYPAHHPGIAEAAPSHQPSKPTLSADATPFVPSAKPEPEVVAIWKEN